MRLKKIFKTALALALAVTTVQVAPVKLYSGSDSKVYAAEYAAKITSLAGDEGISSQIIDGVADIGNLSEGRTFRMNVDTSVAGAYDLSFSSNASAGGSLSIVNESAESRLTEIAYSSGNNDTNGQINLVKGDNSLSVTVSGGISDIDDLTMSAQSALYEAEAGRRGGYAQIAASDTASGGAVVTQIGGVNTDLGNVVIDVYVPSDGVYGMLISYVSQTSSPFYVSINGGEKVTVSQASDRTFDDGVSTKGMEYVEGRMNAGYNKVKIYSDNDKVANIDCVTVFSNKEAVENVYEDDSATLSGSASKRRIYRAENGYGIGNLGPDGSAEFNVNVGAGTYTLGIWYSAAEYRGLEVYVDGRLADTLYCPITGEDYNIETVTTEIDLGAGSHTIKFTNRYSQAPDIDKIQLTRTEDTPKTVSSIGTKTFENSNVKIVYDMAAGKADFYDDGVLRVEGIESVVKLEDESYINTVVKSSDYTLRRVETEELSDGFGNGTAYTVISNAVGKPEMRQTFYLYDDKEYALVKVEVRSEAGLKSNFLAPITAMGDKVVDIGEISDGRSLFVPYDNDNWVRYKGNAFGGQNKSYWATSVYDNTSRNSVVTGSVDHDTWKTGNSTYTTSDGVNFLGSFAGIWSAADTYDYLPHGSIDGTSIESPKMFLGYFEDWRDGMEEYGSANSCNVPMLEWENGTPFGYNSWYGQGSSVNYEESCAVSDFMTELEGNGFVDDSGVAYINLDSYWDSFSDDELEAFVEKCHANGQKAGIYWSHFVFWATDLSWKMGVPGRDEDTYLDAALGDGNGGVAAMAKDSGNLPLDPTSDAMKARLDYFMSKFVDLGFEYLKIDFLNYAAIEGVHADPNVKTGMQAYNQAVEMFTEYVDTSKFFLSYSIAPLFPYQYAHARRISCDTAANIGEIAYMMNSLTYGWWEDDTLYKFVDPDHISFAASPMEARTRYNSAVICGSVMLLSDSYKSSAMKELTKKLTSNTEINEIAKLGKAFRPVEGNVDEWADNIYVLNTDDAFYIAAFNFDSGDKELTVNFERAGLSSGVQYEVKDLWSGQIIRAQDEFKVRLMPSESTIYKIEK